MNDAITKNSTKHSSQTALTPQELADKLDKLVDKVQELAEVYDSKDKENQKIKNRFIKYIKRQPPAEKPKNEWASKAVYNYRISQNPATEGVMLPLHRIETLAPELYNQLIKPAIEIADKAGRIYKQPAPLDYIILDKNHDNMEHDYDSGDNFITIGLPYLRKQQNMQEAISIISHEWGHAYHSYAARVDHHETDKDKKRTKIVGREECTPNRLIRLEELHADRFAEPIDRIASHLNAIINNPKNYRG